MILALIGCAEILWDTRTFNCDEQSVCLDAPGSLRFVDQGELDDTTCRIESTGRKRVTPSRSGCLDQDDTNGFTLEGVLRARAVNLSRVEGQWGAHPEPTEETYIELRGITLNDEDTNDELLSLPRVEVRAGPNGEGSFSWDAGALALTLDCNECAVVTRDVYIEVLTLSGSSSAVICEIRDGRHGEVHAESMVLLQYVGESPPMDQDAATLSYRSGQQGAPPQCSY